MPAKKKLLPWVKQKIAKSVTEIEFLREYELFALTVNCGVKLVHSAKYVRCFYKIGSVCAQKILFFNELGE